jgi:hypothetical protein
MINKCSNREELSFFDHRSNVIRPVNILLDIGQTILIGGIARIDVKHVSLWYSLIILIIILFYFR